MGGGGGWMGPLTPLERVTEPTPTSPRCVSPPAPPLGHSLPVNRMPLSARPPPSHARLLQSRATAGFGVPGGTVTSDSPTEPLHAASPRPDPAPEAGLPRRASPAALGTPLHPAGLWG